MKIRRTVEDLIKELECLTQKDDVEVTKETVLAAINGSSLAELDKNCLKDNYGLEGRVQMTLKQIAERECHTPGWAGSKVSRTVLNLARIMRYQAQMEKAGENDTPLPIDELSARVRNRLSKCKIRTIEGLLEFTAVDVTRMKYLGPLSVAGVRQMLAKRGLRLKGDPVRVKNFGYGCVNEAQKAARAGEVTVAYFTANIGNERIVFAVAPSADPPMKGHTWLAGKLVEAGFEEFSYIGGLRSFAIKGDENDGLAAVKRAFGDEVEIVND